MTQARALDVTIPEHLAEQAEIPVLTGLQRQGDLLVIPARPVRHRGRMIPAGGVPALRGEVTGNAHLLVGTGWWRPGRRDSQHVGTLTVPEGGSAYMLHVEHAGLGIGPGTYRVRRQREMADRVRLVAD